MTILENRLERMTREMYNFACVMNRRRQWQYENIMPDAYALAPQGDDCFQRQIWFMSEIIYSIEQKLIEANDIVQDFNLNATIRIWDNNTMGGRFYCFTPNELSRAGRDQWDLDKFDTMKPQIRKLDPFIDSFPFNNTEFLEDALGVESRLDYFKAEFKDIRKTTADRNEKDAAIAIMAYVRSVETEIKYGIEYLGSAEAEYQEYVDPPKTTKEKKRIARNYIRNDPVRLNKNIFKPIDRAKVPVPDRSLLIRYKLDDLDALQ